MRIGLAGSSPAIGPCSFSNECCRTIMRKIINGEPHIVRHECRPERKGQIMTSEELHAFAVKTLKEEYEMSSSTVMTPPGDHMNAADLCLVSVRSFVNIKVIYSDTLAIDFSRIDTAPMIDRFYKHGEIPRLTVASAWCFDSDGGKPEICGGSFCFRYYSFSLIPNEVNHPLPEMLSPLQLASTYAETWKNLDADILEPYLDKDFHYSSDWVFDVMPSRYEFMGYFRGKLNTIRKNPNITTVKPAFNQETGQAGVIIRQGNNSPVIILIDTRAGRIISATMKEFVPKPEDSI